jgi:hypothetical protein
MIVDRSQAEMFSALGRTRSAFHGIAKWPTLDEMFSTYSRHYLERYGKAQWEAAGGEYTAKGKPTCRPTSFLAVEAVRQVVGEQSGVLWPDDDGVVWAVRFVPAANGNSNGLFGFSISWHNSALPLDPQVRDQYEEAVKKAIAAPVGTKLKAARRKLDLMARQLRLYQRAEQILWAIHLAVMNQGSSTVLLPDVQLGQIIWGGDRASWPSDWRGQIMSVLKSLMSLRAEVLKLSPCEWRPRVGATSVAVAYAELLALTRPQQDICRECCPMWGRPERHNHVLIQVGLGFLGVLENFMTGSPDWGRTYDFTSTPKDEQGKLIREARRAGQIIPINAPTAILGNAKWSPLKGAPGRIVQALVREVTRIPRGHRSEPSGRPEVLVGNQTPGVKPNTRVTCPLLVADGRYVTFGGNGHRAGMGYTIIGKQGNGWLSKCGFSVPDDASALRKTTKDFLANLAKLTEILGLIVVGLQPTAGGIQWLSIGDLCRMARSGACWRALTAVHLRVYSPEDYLARIRNCMEQAGRFTVIPGGDEDNVPVAAVAAGQGSDLAGSLARLNITQTEIAERLRIKQPSVSDFVNGRRPWPDWVRQGVQELIAERLAAAAGVADEDVS